MVPKEGERKKDDAKRHAGEGKGGKKGGKRSTPALLVRLLMEDEVSNHREAWQAVLLVLAEFKDTWGSEKGAAVSTYLVPDTWQFEVVFFTIVCVVFLRSPWTRSSIVRTLRF